ncbi:MAG: hypothetical protein CMI69_02875, partial [Candidatus Pelagibacter sp.]|nr:hypothetical protein [Candidatus Pelagibacter sp.]
IKSTVKNERRVLLYEFHDRKSYKPMGKIIIDNSKITKKMGKNLDFLLPNNNNNISHENYGGAPYSENLPLYTPLRVFYYYFKSFCKLFINRIKRKITKKNSKNWEKGY